MNRTDVKTVIGIDVGGSATKIVGFRTAGDGTPTLITPQLCQAADPLTSLYGAFGKFAAINDLQLPDIDRVMMTGVGSTYAKQPIYNLDCRSVPEFTAIGLGGLYLSHLDEAIIVSMGTGTALIHAKRENDRTQTEYLGGTGVGGGTLLGLNHKILGVDTFEHIEQLCRDGNLANVDLRISDISKNHSYTGINESLTASNFGKLSDLATPGDIALGIANMVAETVLMISVFAARSYHIRDVVLTGNLSTMEPIAKVFSTLGPVFDINFITPEHAVFATVIGAALYEGTQS